MPTVPCFSVPTVRLCLLFACSSDPTGSLFLLAYCSLVPLCLLFPCSCLLTVPLCLLIPCSSVHSVPLFLWAYWSPVPLCLLFLCSSVFYCFPVPLCYNYSFHLQYNDVSQVVIHRPWAQITNKVNKERDKRKHQSQEAKHSVKLMCTVVFLKGSDTSLWRRLNFKLKREQANSSWKFVN